MKGGKLPFSKIAGYDGKGRIWVNPKVPSRFRGINVRKRLLTHEKTEIKLRKLGLPYKHAHKLATKVEHKGLSRKQVAVYEGLLGAIARWHPRKRRGG
jgi:hypothetical protein